jgi:transcriptional regulator GlxA family with amidase domain
MVQARESSAVIGMSLRDFVRDLRLNRAHDLLLGSSLSLTTLAVDAGFYDLPHFDKAFRQRLGVSPQESRRRHGRRRNGGVAARTTRARTIIRPAIAPGKRS